MDDEQRGAATAELPYRKMMSIWRDLKDVIIKAMPQRQSHQPHALHRNCISHHKNPWSMIPTQYMVLEQLGSFLSASIAKREIKESDVQQGNQLKWPNIMIEVGCSEPLFQLSASMWNGGWLKVEYTRTW